MELVEVEEEPVEDVEVLTPVPTEVPTSEETDPVVRTVEEGPSTSTPRLRTSECCLSQIVQRIQN